MKKICVLILAAVFGLSISSQAQDTTSTVKKTGQAIKKGAKKVGNKTAEIASKGKSRITDKVYKGKMAAGGQTIYIDNHSRYYWIDRHGRRHYTTEARLKDKPVDKKEKQKD